MRVLQCIQSMNLHSGGPTTCTRDLLDALNAIGGSVDLLTFKDSENVQLIAGAESSWIRLVENDCVSPLALSKNFRQALFQSDYDLYHCNAIWMYSNHITCKTARNKGKPYVLSPHGMLYPTALAIKAWKKKPMLWVWFNKDIHNASCLHATCEEEMKHCRDFGYKGPIAVIPNPVVFPEGIECKTVLDKEPLIGFLGRLNPIKKVENLLYGARIAIRKGSAPFKIHIMGSGAVDYEHFLKEEVNRLGLTDIVKFVGFVSGKDKYERLSQFRALFVPSLQENFGMIVPEALICGTPVYASLGTPWSKLNDNRCGWWLDNSPETIAGVIEKTLNMTEDELLAMGTRGRRLMEEHYEQNKVAKMMLDLYRWLINGGEKPDFVYE